MIVDIETICKAVHKAYCEERIRQKKEPYWTGGDYSKLDEATKDYDRAIVRAVLQAVNYDQLQAKIEQQARHIRLLQDTDDTSTKTIAGLQAENETYENVFRWIRQRRAIIITAPWLSHKTGISIKKILDWQDNEIEEPKDVY